MGNLSSYLSVRRSGAPAAGVPLRGPQVPPANSKRRSQRRRKNVQERLRKMMEDYRKMPRPQPTLRVKRVHPQAVLPSKQLPGDAGYDLVACETTVLDAGTRNLVRTGLVMEIPEGYCGRILSRSGLAATSSVDVCAGVVDSGYRGEVMVLLANNGTAKFRVLPGRRIAQLLLMEVGSPAVQELPAEVPLSETVRGTGGFGSTGTGSDAPEVAAASSSSSSSSPPPSSSASAEAEGGQTSPPPSELQLPVPAFVSVHG
jgi:dUTP pyrophosphatase